MRKDARCGEHPQCARGWRSAIVVEEGGQGKTITAVGRDATVHIGIGQLRSRDDSIAGAKVGDRVLPLMDAECRVEKEDIGLRCALKNFAVPRGPDGARGPQIALQKLYRLDVANLIEGVGGVDSHIPPRDRPPGPARKAVVASAATQNERVRARASID